MIAIGKSTKKHDYVQITKIYMEIILPIMVYKSIPGGKVLSFDDNCRYMLNKKSVRYKSQLIVQYYERMV